MSIKLFFVTLGAIVACALVFRLCVLFAEAFAESVHRAIEQHHINSERKKRARFFNLKHK